MRCPVAQTHQGLGLTWVEDMAALKPVRAFRSRTEDAHTESLREALGDLYAEATYGVRSGVTRTEDDDVPALRLYACELAIELLTHFPADTNAAARMWLEAAPADPLPEIRHLELPEASALRSADGV
ncbi:hypothetical protein GCM10009552_29020 [Rothia nasimurium]